MNIKEMREAGTVLPVPRIEALVLPIEVERAIMQKPHADMINRDTQHSYVAYQQIIHIHKASTVASILTSIRNLPDFDASRKSVK